VLAIDTLSRARSAWQSVLWRRELAQQIPGVRRYTNIQPRARSIRPGMPRYSEQDALGRPVGVLGPVLAGGVIYLHYDSLVCADPLSGATLWVRRGISSGSELIGDDGLLLVVTASNGGQTLDAMGFSPVDGRFLGQRTLVKRTGSQTGVTSVTAVQGRRILATTLNVGGGIKLALRDPWAQKTIWSQTFPLGTKSCLVEGDSVAVLDPTGHFLLLALADGQPRIDLQIGPEPNLKSIHVLPSSKQFLLVTDVRSKSQKNRIATAMPGLMNQPVVSGHVYAFDRQTGQLQWPKPAQLQSRGLWLTQPRELPVVVFAQLISQRDSNGRTRGNMAVVCLDRRTGRAVYEAADLPRAGGNLDLEGQPKRKTVTLRTAARNSEMTWTDTPVEKPEPPFQESGPGTASTGGPTGIFRLLDAIPRAIAKAAGAQAVPRPGSAKAVIDPFDEAATPNDAMGKPAAPGTKKATLK
jgi:outer membrane protein assembly factor BamB